MQRSTAVVVALSECEAMKAGDLFENVQDGKICIIVGKEIKKINYGTMTCNFIEVLDVKGKVWQIDVRHLRSFMSSN